MSLKSLPAIDQVLLTPAVSSLCDTYSREVVVEWARAAIEELRQELAGGQELPVGPDHKLSADLVRDRVLGQAALTIAPSLKPVVNATGVVIHTNLGRAPLSPSLVQAMQKILGSYSNLEFDLAAGDRGSRHAHLERLIRLVTGAESGFVVNNNAAAVLAALNTLALGREVIVSRGELIEIGGSFRIPEIIGRGGAILREVGTTNKTRMKDYEDAIGPETALLLKVHTSNYKIMGFTEEAGIRELSELGRRRGIPLMVDLGSGLLIDLAPFGIKSEKPVRWYVEAGADLITFSGDKLLGGPQAGFIVGRRELTDRVKKNPLVRALRVGKLTISALEAMLIEYLSPASLLRKVPALSLLIRPAQEIEAEAKNLMKGLREAWPAAELAVEADEAFAGGGSLPVEPLPTFVVTAALPGLSAEDLLRAFRQAPTPVIGRLRHGRFCLDCRTLLPGDRELILQAAAGLKPATGS